MSTPTPSDFARHLTQRKQHEIEREQQIADLEKKLAKSSSEKHDRTVQKNRARFGSGKARESAASHSSRKGKAQDASTTPRSSRRGTGKGTSSKSAQTARTSTPTTSSTSQSKPLKKQDVGTESAKGSSSETSVSPATPKKPFVRKPHLTQRLSDNEALLELQKSFPKTKHHNRSAKSTRSSSKRK